MPVPRIDMRKIKDVLRLKLDAGLSHQQIATALGISKGVVTKYVGLAAAAGLNWAAVQDADETTLERRLLVARECPRDHVQPDYGRLHHELRRKGMTLMLLWDETNTRPVFAHYQDRSRFGGSHRGMAPRCRCSCQCSGSARYRLVPRHASRREYFPGTRLSTGRSRNHEGGIGPDHQGKVCGQTRCRKRADGRHGRRRPSRSANLCAR